MRWVAFGACGLLAVACVSTDPDLPASHPANPSLAGSPSSFDTAVLRPGFEPFERYEPAGSDAAAPLAGHGAHDAQPSVPEPSVPEPSAGEPSAPSQPKSPGAAPATTSYTCPMHPEIVRPGPGRCPKCGMKLVPKKAGRK
jgi:hypothetical protein